MMHRLLPAIVRPGALVVLALALAVAACAPQAPPASPAAQRPAPSAAPQSMAEIATYRGADRQQLLEEGARREGKLTWYTALIVNQAVRPIVDAFRAKYPYIEVEYWRANGGEIVQRVMLEYQANRFDVDIADGGSTGLLLREAGFAQPFYSPALDAYPAHLKDKDGYWATPNLYFMALGYNTQLVSRQDVPKTYQDLLDPRWKGKMAWSTSVGAGGAPLLVGTLLETMGQERGMAYLNQLAKQDVRNLDVAARTVLDMAIAGEFPIALEIFNHHAAISAQQGAPVDWQPLEPVPAQNGALSLPARAPHPHAALLFLDFMLAEDGGQQVLREADYLPAHPDVEAKIRNLKPEQGGFQANFLGVEATYQKEPQWVDTFQTLFLRH